MATNSEGKAPRAMIHKRILESAESAPEASLESIAAEVAGASPALVERVLDEYGDPADSTPAEEAGPDAPTADSSDGELSEAQRETLEAIADRPDATQAVIAEELDVSPATVSRRLSDVPGFEWSDRAAFVATFLEADGTDSSAESRSEEEQQTADGHPDEAADSASGPEPTAAVDGGQPARAEPAAVEEVRDRIEELEAQAERDAGQTGRPIEDPELLAKVMRAVLADDSITAAEELDVLEALL